MPIAFIRRWWNEKVRKVETCHLCGRAVELDWWVRPSTWELFTGKTNDDGLILCARCFDWRAQGFGYHLRWSAWVDHNPLWPPPGYRRDAYERCRRGSVRSWAEWCKKYFAGTGEE